MINFKYLGLPLLVGFLGRVYGAEGDAAVQSSECELTINQNSVTASNCTVGIYKKDENIIKCTGTTLQCSLVNLPWQLRSGCQESYIGNIIKTGEGLYEFCLGKFGNEYPSLSLNGTDSDNYGKYFVQHTPQKTNNIFSFDLDAQYYVIDYNEKGIAFDNTYNVTNHCADTSGKLKTRKETFCSADGSGYYYTCNYGICNEIRNQTTYEIIEKEIEEIETDPECKFSISVDSCSINNTSKCGNIYNTEVLRSTNGNAITDSSTGVIVKVGKKNETIPCDVYKSSGYYLNKDKNTKVNYPLIKCDGSSCILTEKTLGYFIDGLDKSKIIHCGDDQCSEIDASNYLYVNADKGLSLIKCDPKSNTNTRTCALIDAKSNSYYCEDATSSSKHLIKCGAEFCEEEYKNSVSTTEYYLDGADSKNVITCSKSTSENVYSCATVAGATSGSKYYIDANISSGKGLIFCTAQTCIRTTGVNRFAYIVGGYDLIVCSNEKCELKTGANENYYINGGSNKNDAPLIGCNNTNCTEIAAGYDNVIFPNANRETLTNGLIYCKQKKSCSEVNAEDGKFYISIGDHSKITATGPNTITKSGITVTTPPYYYLVNKDNLEILVNNQISGGLVKCENNACSLVQGSYDSFYINKGTSDDENLIQASGNSLSFVETIDDGYYINNENNVIQCFNNKCAKYSTDKTDCDVDNALGVMIGKVLCSKNAKKGNQPSLTTTAKKYILNLADGTIHYGNQKLAAGPYLISADSKKVVVVKHTSTAYYLADATTNGIVNAVNQAGELYECGSSGPCTRPASSITDTNDHFYPNDDEETYKSKYVRILCKNEGSSVTCKGRAAGSDDYYCIYDDKLLTICQAGCPTDKNNCSVLKSKVGYYLSKADNTYLIKCTSDSNCDKWSSFSIGYYKSQDISNQLIQCFESFGKRCQYVSTINSGYYISENNNLIECTSKKVCTDSKTVTSEGWYVSGEAGMALTHCYSEGGSGSVVCVADSKPKLGWYINHTGTNLIKCTLSNTGNVSCEEKEIANSGYYLNAADASHLIKCTKGSGCVQDSVQVQEKSYYLNGEDKHLIYCDKDKKCTGYRFIKNKKLWFRSTDDIKLIGCTKNEGCVEYESPSQTGYYLNGEEDTSYAPLISYNIGLMKFDISDDSLKKGWYVNGDESAANAQKIIKCVDSDSCDYKDVKTQACGTSILGEFTVNSGSLEWCNTDAKAISLNSDVPKTAIVKYRNEVVPGVTLPENTREAYALIEYTSTYIYSTSIDGFKLDKDNLYYCPIEMNGVCTKVESIENGYYLEYAGDNSKIIKCVTGKCEVISSNPSSCTEANVILEGTDLKLCSGDTPIKEMDKFNIDYLYSLKKSTSFPGVEGRYFMATVNKYYVKLVKEITEVPSCKDGMTNVCISGDKVKDGNLGAELSGTTEVDNEFKNKPIKFPYYTNNGYFIYNGSELQTVYVLKDDEFNYKCTIGSVCVDEEKHEVAIVYYKLGDDEMLIAVYDIDIAPGVNEKVVDVINEGEYRCKVGTENRICICDKKGRCSLKEQEAGIEVTDDGIKIGSYESNPMYTQYIPENTNINSRKRADDELDYQRVLELTHVSYTSEDSTRNIFIDDSNRMISGEDGVSIAAGYTCKLGRCKEIQNDGVYQYYINTVQSGKAANAVVRCGGNQCIFLDAGKRIVPNANSEGPEDALISCTGSSCDVVAITSDIGIPLCKPNNGNTAPKENNGHFERADTGESLADDQYCLLNGLLYSKSESVGSVFQGIYMFDVTYRKIDTSLVRENHVYASLYNCVDESGSVKCKRTFGFITNGENYSECNKNGCSFMGKPVDTKCSINGAGTLISATDSVKLCIDDKDSNAVDVKSGVTQSYYALAIDVDNVYPEIGSGNNIIVVVKDNVAYTLSEDGYLLLQNGNTIASTIGESGELYECNNIDNNCNHIENPVNGYYDTVFSYSSIACEDKACSIDANTQTFTEEGEIKYEYLESGFPGGVQAIAVKSHYKINALVADNYILLDDEDGIKLAEVGTENKSRRLYQCTSSLKKCIKKDVKPGWYVNGDNNNKAIKCESEYCTVEKELNKSCSSFGELIFKDNSYQICYTKAGSYKLSEKIGEVVTMNVGSNVNKFPLEYDIVSITSNSVIGLAKSRDVSSGNDEDKYSSLMTCSNYGSTTEACKIGSGSNASELGTGVYCKKEGSNNATLKLYRTVLDGQAKKCTEYKGVVVLYGNKVDNDGKVGSQMYYCDDNTCRLTTGYYKVGSNVISCDGVECKKITTDLTDVGVAKTDGKLIIKAGDEKGLSSTINHYYIEGNNIFPGADGKEAILVETGVDYHVIFKGEGYYLINSQNVIIDKDDDNTSSGNTLYYCDANNLSCIKQEKINGYYINSASKSSDGKIKAIIVCDGNECYIAKQSENNIDLYNNLSSCSSTTIGRLIRDSTEKQIKICVNKNGESFTNNASTVKYFVINLTQGNRFGGIRLEDTGEEHENDKANVLVKITNRSVTQQSIKGHILIGSSKEVVESLNGRGTLNLCDEIVYSGTKSTIQCNEVSNIKNGWYFNNYFNDNRYVKCNGGSNGCVVAEAKLSASCENSGSLIYNNNKFRVCKTLNKQIDIGGDYQTLMNVSYMEEFPGVNTNNTNILLNVKNYNITLNSHNGYLVVKNDDMNVIDENNIDESSKFTKTSGDIYNCENDGVCSKIENPENNYYLKSNSTGIANDLIKCNNKICRVNKNSDKGFYVSSNKQNPLIQCIQEGNVDEQGNYIDTTLKRVCRERTFNEGWYLNSDNENKENKPLIKCNSEKGCIESENPGNGWYLNAGSTFGNDRLSNSNVNAVIECSSTGCMEYSSPIGKTCTKGGEIIHNQKYKLCLNSNDSVEMKNESIQVLSVANYNDFPSASSGIILVRIRKNDIIQIINSEPKYYLKDGLMYSCTETCEVINDNDKTGIIVYEELSENLWTADCANNVCNWNRNINEGNVFLKANNIIFDYSGDNPSLNDISTVYKCRKDDSNAIKCKEETGKKGYYYNAKHKTETGNKNTLYKYVDESNSWELATTNEVRKCTSLNYKKNICYISLDDEVYTEELVQEKPNYIKAGEVCVNGSGVYYFALSEINTGIDKMNCIQIPSDNSLSYYTVNSKVYRVDKYGVSEVDGSNYINALNLSIINESSDNVKNGIWFESGNLNEYTITCIDGNCSREKTISCSYDFQLGKCKLASGQMNAGQVCKSDNNVMYLALERVSTFYGNCVKYESGLIPEDNEGAVDETDSEWKYYVIDKKMYRINESAVEILGQGVYIIDKGNNAVKINNSYELDISENSLYTMYVCSNEGCEIKNSCLFENEYEYIYDRIEENVVKCNPNNGKVTRISSKGYYLNSPSKTLIKCYNNSSTCKEINEETGMEGYYRDAGNEEKMIVCLRNSSKFVCESRDMVRCTYDENRKLCQSNINLLRNSYCYFSKDDKVRGKIEHILYVENFIRKGEEGKCISADTNDYYFKYKKSKFVGHEEHEGIIKVSKDEIINIYEKDKGYYIIDTKNGVGITEDTELKKSRMYVCEKDLCVENRNPESGTIYVNKASSQKLVKFSEGKWNIINSRCDIDINNEEICNLKKGTNLSKGDIIYNIDKDEIKMYDVITESGVSDKTKLEKQKELINGTYLEYGGDLYYFTKDKQQFIPQSEGYYFFNENKENDKIYQFNWSVYQSTINRTEGYYSEGSLNIYVYNNDFGSMKDGYYLNNADNENLGIFIQKMSIPNKIKVSADDGTNNSEGSSTPVEYKSVYKAVINKCTTNNGNICVGVEDGKTIPKGSACVVTEGDYKGFYFAIAAITKSSKTKNCIKYGSENVYQFENNKMEFNGIGTYQNIIFEVSSNSIIPFDHDYKTDNYRYGYFIYDENKPLTSTTLKDTNQAYICDVVKSTDGGNENIDYKCSKIPNSKKYYYNSANDAVVYNDGNRWKVESEKGYYFFNENGLAANVAIDESGNDDSIKNKISIGTDVNYAGKYINRAINDNVNVVLVDYDKTDYRIANNELYYCKVNSNNVCTSRSDSPLQNNSACYDKDTKKLYITSEVQSTVEGQSNVMYCYTGSIEKVKYVLVDEKLYQLDGQSIKEMENGYYILDDKMESFNADYPEVASKFISCTDGGCQELNEEFVLNLDVIFNEAGNDEERNSLLRYYSSERKFKKITEKGNYCITNDVTYPRSEEECGSKSRYFDNTGLHPMNCGNDDICFNYAKKDENNMIYQNKILEESTFVYDEEKDVIKYNNEYNLDENERLFRFYKEKLYLLKPDRLQFVNDEGLYLMKNGKPFDNGEWTSLSGRTEVCYYENGVCNNQKLMEYRKNKYVINKSTKEATIATYDGENDLWRIVKEDGYYFFFVDEYSINEEDRRIEFVYEIMDGKVREIDYKDHGFYIFNNLMIEGMTDSWEDGERFVQNVDVNNRRKCTAIETDEIIDPEEFCYSSGYGLCKPKLTISDKNEDAVNCMFSENNSVSYYVVEGKLFVVNTNYYQYIDGDGLYIIGNDNQSFESRNEGKAEAYLCESSECKIADDLESKYYLNIASEYLGHPNVMYYNKNSNTWRKCEKPGIYIFNDKGYPLNEDENVSYAYEIDSENNIKPIDIGSGEIYVSMSGGIGDILVKDGKGSRIPECKYNKNTRSVVSKTQLNVGDICISDEELIVIKSAGIGNTKRDEEYSYEGIVTSDGKKKVIYIEDNKSLAIIENGVVVPFASVNGKIILDTETLLPINDLEEKEAEVYDCNDNGCNLVDSNGLTKDKYYINMGETRYPLLKYLGEGKWSAESNEGYYFFGKNGSAVAENDSPYFVIEVTKNNGVVEQENITDENSVGYFFNKANNSKYIISNNDQYWSKGISIRNCNVVVLDDGVLCKTTKEDDIYRAGEYCYKSNSKQLYLLTADATFTDENANCLYGTNEKPKFVDSAVISNSLNNVNVGNTLLRLDSEAIRVVKPGYYIINQNGEIIDNNDDENVVMNVYKCSNNGCEQVYPGAEEMIKTEDGGLFVIGEDGKLQKINEDGLYFFDTHGAVCKEDSCEVGSIIRISENGEKKEELGLNDLPVGVYVNEGQKTTAGVYDGGNWRIVEIGCQYASSESSCSNDEIELGIGSYCISSGKMYIINEISAETEIKKCIPGSDTNVVYFNSSDKKLMKVKEKSISYVNEDGYFAIDGKQYVAFSSEELISSKFIRCEGKQCTNVKPDIASYVNKAPEEFNIVTFPTGKEEEAKTSNKGCNVNGNKCSATEGKLNAGDVCINNDSLYLVDSGNSCYKADKNSVTYQIVSGKLYMLNNDSVVQKTDGYYFIGKDQRAVSSKSGYSDSGVVGYKCSNSGECSKLTPKDGRYYADYTTKNENGFSVVSYDSSRKVFVSIAEDGIVRLDDGSYVVCEFNNNNEVNCKDISEVGSYIANNEDLIDCVKNEEGVVECTIAINGGFYILKDKQGDRLVSCEPNAERLKMVCKDIDKEGYFMVRSTDELFKCEEKVEEVDNANISAFDFRSLYKLLEGSNKMRRQEDGALGEVNEDGNNGDGEGQEEGNNGEGDGGNESGKSQDPVDVEPESKDVECRRITCERKDDVISFTSDDTEVQMYVCVALPDPEATEEDGESNEILKFVPESCDSGNYVKKNDDFYDCVDMGKLNEEEINKAYDEKTDDKSSSTSSKEQSTTTTEKTSSSAAASTTKSSVSSTKASEPTEKPTSTTATKTTTTQKNEPTTTTKKSDAISIIHSIPSLTFYLILFIFSYYIFI